MTKQQLKTIKANTDNKLTKKVINVILDQEASYMEGYIKDLLNHGCQSGMVGELIYYTDTVKFYEKYKTEIKAMLKEALDETGLKSPLELFGDKWDEEDIFVEEDMNKNLLAWFGFEETVRQIAYELEMEV